MTTSADKAVQTIGQIAVTVRDLARSKHFYGEILGIPFLFDAGTMAFFQCGAVRLMLGTAEKPDAEAKNNTILYFKVNDIQTTHAHLADCGVVFLQAPHLVTKMPDHDLWMAFLKDPDGNTAALMSEVPRAE
jgi:methylmalonyl-CoA/ethylmalonyl-CoA epimerase